MPEKQKLIDIAQRGRMAAAGLNEWGNELDAMEKAAVNSLVLEFRSGPISSDRLRDLAAQISAARQLRENMESAVRAGRVAGERLHRDE